MIVQFAEHKALVLAYEDLLEAGIPAEAMQVGYTQQNANHP